MQNGSFEVATVLQPLAQGAEAAAGGFRAQRRVRNAPFGAEAATVSQPLLEGAEAAAEGFSAGRNVLNGFETLYRQEVYLPKLVCCPCCPLMLLCKTI